jgi:hypothetical protein
MFMMTLNPFNASDENKYIYWYALRAAAQPLPDPAQVQSPHYFYISRSRVLLATTTYQPDMCKIKIILETDPKKSKTSEKSCHGKAKGTSRVSPTSLAIIHLLKNIFYRILPPRLRRRVASPILLSATSQQQCSQMQPRIKTLSKMGPKNPQVD